MIDLRALSCLCYHVFLLCYFLVFSFVLTCILLVSLSRMKPHARAEYFSLVAFLRKVSYRAINGTSTKAASHSSPVGNGILHGYKVNKGCSNLNICTKQKAKHPRAENKVKMCDSLYRYLRLEAPSLLQEADHLWETIARIVHHRRPASVVLGIVVTSCTQIRLRYASKRSVFRGCSRVWKQLISIA